MANSYLLGSTVTLTKTFRVAGVATDPSAVTVQIGDGIGSPTTYVYGTDVELTKTGTGAYSIAVVPDAVGTWGAIWTGTGDVNDVEVQQFDIVNATPPWELAGSPSAYASLPQLRAALRLDSTDDVDETELLRCLQTASRQIDGEVSRRSAGAVTDYIGETVPLPITEACILIAVALYKRPQAPFGVLENTLDGSPVQIGKDFHVDALIASVVPTSWSVV